MKYKSKKITSLLIGSIMISNSLPNIVMANILNDSNINTKITECYVLSETTLIEEEISTYGSYKPSFMSGTFDLSKATYNYTVNSLYYQVFTDKWLTGVSNIHVDIENLVATNVVEALPPATILVSLYDSSSNLVGSEWLYNGGIKKFSNLNKSEKYYVKFSSGSNNICWSFNGSIEGS